MVIEDNFCFLYKSLLQLAIRCDEEFNTLLSSTIISHGGVLPKIQLSLLPKKKTEVPKMRSSSPEF